MLFLISYLINNNNWSLRETRILSSNTHCEIMELHLLFVLILPFQYNMFSCACYVFLCLLFVLFFLSFLYFIAATRTLQTHTDRPPAFRDQRMRSSTARDLQQPRYPAGDPCHFLRRTGTLDSSSSDSVSQNVESSP